MQNMLKVLIWVFLFFIPVWLFAAAQDCIFVEWSGDWSEISDQLKNCLSESNVVQPTNDLLVGTGDDWLDESLTVWVWSISTLLYLAAILAIVYGSLMMVLSTWEEEKIKKAKDIIKWWIIGFVWVLLAKEILQLVTSFIWN